jgi:hypothetical protein
MNNEQMAPKVREWLKSTDVEPEDIRRSVGTVSGQARVTPQRGRWWPMPRFRRAADVPSNDSHARPRPFLAPAAVGHTPTIHGRTLTMFSPAKVILIGAFVALFGGLLTWGALEPSSRTAVAPGAESAAPTDAMDAVTLGENEFTGSLSIRGGLSTGVSDVIRYRYGADEMSDPRFAGDWDLDYTQVHGGGDSGWRYLYHAAFRMTDDQGAWQEKPNLTLEFSDDTASSRTSALVGEGAYEGLTAVAELTYVPQGRFEIHGVVIDGAVPPAPDQALAAEQ